MTLNPNSTFTNEKTEQELTRDIFTHIRQILERDGDQAQILFNAIQLRKLLQCEPTLILMDAGTTDLPHANWPAPRCLEVGKIIDHPTHGNVLIIAGSFMGDYGRVSNFWRWQKVDGNGQAIGDIMSGYGTEFY